MAKKVNNGQDPWIEQAAKKNEKKPAKEQKGKQKPSKLEESLAKKDEELAKLITSQQELVTLLKHVQADYENFKKRVEKERDMHVTHTSASFVRKLLPLLDSFEKAEQHPEDSENILKGFRLIHAQLLDLLKHEGLEPIKAVGERFDPTLHEVLIKEQSDKQKNLILEELQKGYFFREKVVRASKVKISSGSEGKGTQENNDDGKNTN